MNKTTTYSGAGMSCGHRLRWLRRTWRYIVDRPLV